jgi:2-polyprenyl-3-methyl-5-hydroxy-6-metoxy-1,4-benzoquinol methylase
MKPGSLVNYANYQIIVNKYIFAGHFVTNKAVLDVGCDKGYGAAYLASKGANVIGVDANVEAIEFAAQYCLGRQLECVCADALSLPFADGFFDVAVAFDIIEHIRDCDRFLLEAKRVLNRSGIFLCSTPNIESHFSLFMPSDHVREFKADELLKLIGAHFDVVALYGQCLVDLERIRMSKLVSAATSLGGHVLSSIPFGANIRQCLTRFIAKENHHIEFSDDFDTVADEGYSVLPFEASLRIPQRLVVVGLKRP